MREYHPPLSFPLFCCVSNPGRPNGEEEEKDRPGQEANAVQPEVCERCGNFRQEARPQQQCSLNLFETTVCALVVICTVHIMTFDMYIIRF